MTHTRRPRRGWARGQKRRLTYSPGARFSDAPAGAGAFPALREAGGATEEAAPSLSPRPSRTLTPPHTSSLQSRPGLGGVCGGSLGLAQSARAALTPGQQRRGKVEAAGREAVAGTANRHGDPLQPQESG